MAERKDKIVLHIRDTMIPEEESAGNLEYINSEESLEEIEGRDECIKTAVRNNVPFVEVNLGALNRALVAKQKHQDQE